MKSLMKPFLALALLLFAATCTAAAEEISNPIVKKLYEKGILTKEEAIEMDKKLASEKKEGNKKENGKIAGAFEKLKIEGLDYLGYTYKNNEKGDDTGDFEIRRAYFAVKAYLDDKNYFRTTLDVTYHNHKDDPAEGDEIDAKLKHLFLYLDISHIIPATGFEFGLVHTPWLDYEEHAGWRYRSISKTFYEAGDGAHLLPSADLGIDFKTKTEYVSAEYGMFNGEGYDHIGRSDMGDKGNFFSNSIEGRLTWHVLGGGRKKPKPTKEDYLNISLHAVDSVNHRGSDDDLKIYQAHLVYNTPLFLAAAQYIKGDWTDGSESEGDGYSFNAEFRPIEDWALFGRVEHWEPDDSQGDWDDRTMYIYGLAWTMNPNVRWILNGITADYGGGADPASKQFNKIMLTAEVSW